jgi:hypothetical protein
MVERAEESAPLRTIDWRKMRLSNGEYCVEIEGIPYSNAEILSLDRKSRGSESESDSEDKIVYDRPPEHELYEDSDASSRQQSTEPHWNDGGLNYGMRLLLDSCVLFDKSSRNLRTVVGVTSGRRTGGPAGGIEKKSPGGT